MQFLIEISNFIKGFQKVDSYSVITLFEILERYIKALLSLIKHSLSFLKFSQNNIILIHYENIYIIFLFCPNKKEYNIKPCL